MSNHKTYKVASEEGAQRYHSEVGETVRLDISKDEELAVVAAGWLEPVTFITKPAKEDK